jgi:hypothetical protein
MPTENAAKIIFMPPPFGSDDRPRYDADIILPLVKGHAAKFAVLGGGGTLNSMIQESVRTGDAGPEVKQKFRDAAELLLREGVAGFGELTAEHFAGGRNTNPRPRTIRCSCCWRTLPPSTASRSCCIWKLYRKTCPCLRR